MRDYAISLAAGAGETLNVSAVTFIRVKSTGSATSVLRFRTQDGSVFTLSQGEKVRLSHPADAVEIENPGASPLTATVTLGQGDADSNALVGTVSVDKAAGLTTVADVNLPAGNTTLVAALAATRRAVLVNNLATNTQTLRLGDSNAGAARGLELAPGGTITLETTAAVYAHNPGAGNVSVAVLEVSD